MTSLKISSDARHFVTPFADYTNNIEIKSLIDAGSQKVNHVWVDQINNCINNLLRKFEAGLKHDVDEDDYSVYTGTAGIAWLFFRLYDKLDRRQDIRYLHKASDLIKPCIAKLKKKRVCDEISFLCGDSGPLAIAAVIFHFSDKNVDSAACIKSILHMANEAVENAEIPDEILYGRAGYLYALLFLRHYLGEATVPDDIVNAVVDAIKTSGEALAAQKHAKFPLLYRWHHSYYTGAAHGLCGIYFLLMRTDGFNTNDDLKRKVKQSVDFLITQRFPSGNYPSSLDKERDELVHWCHGAPGFIHMFIQAYRVYGDEIYLNEARSCADVLWNRGLLLKGYGLCHGPAGNAYGFLALFQLTQESKYLYRALKFAEWMFAYGEHGCRIADRPFSLFEGMAGTLYFLADILHPNEAAFPAFYY